MAVVFTLLGNISAPTGAWTVNTKTGQIIYLDQPASQPAPAPAPLPQPSGIRTAPPPPQPTAPPTTQPPRRPSISTQPAPPSNQTPAPAPTEAPGLAPAPSPAPQEEQPTAGVRAEVVPPAQDFTPPPAVVQPQAVVGLSKAGRIFVGAAVIAAVGLAGLAVRRAHQRHR